MIRKIKSKTLPSNYIDLKEYISKNSIELTEHVVSSIEFAIKKNIPTIEIFDFNKTDYVIELSSSSYKENLEYIYNNYIKEEKYEYCTRLAKVLSYFDH